MANRCPNCMKFVSLETEEEPEEQSLEVDDDGDDGAQVTAEYRVVRKCAECGDEAKDATYNLEGEVTLEHQFGEETVVGHAPGCEEDERELDVEADISVDERLITTDRNGKPIKRMRYMRTDIVLTAEMTVTCNKCGATGSTTLEEATSAGSFDELW